MSQDLNAPTVVLDYVSDGRTTDNASKINSYAERTIESYIDYGFAENSKTTGGGEKQRLLEIYRNERRILRGRMNDLDLQGIVNIFRKNYTGTVKS